MTPGREYGMLKYGRNTYDHWRHVQWFPIPPEPPTDIWAPVVDAPPPIWGSNTSSLTEIWVPIVEPAQPPWTPA